MTQGSHDMHDETNTNKRETITGNDLTKHINTQPTSNEHSKDIHDDNEKLDTIPALMDETNEQHDSSDEDSDEINDIESVDSSDNSNSDNDNDDSNNNTEDETTLFDETNIPYELNKKRKITFHTSRENISNRKDNLVIFVSPLGEPYDKGAHALLDAQLFPKLTDVTVARARPTPYKRYHIIALAVNNKVSEVVERETIKEVMYSLLDVTKELGLESFSICQGDVGSVPWTRIRENICEILDNTGITITICKNEIITPRQEQWQGIIHEHHTSAIGGHKGVTKMYKRIYENYYWPRMKVHIQQYIRNCRNAN